MARRRLGRDRRRHGGRLTEWIAADARREGRGRRGRDIAEVFRERFLTWRLVGGDPAAVVERLRRLAAVGIIDRCDERPRIERRGGRGGELRLRILSGGFVGRWGRRFGRRRLFLRGVCGGRLDGSERPARRRVAVIGGKALVGRHAALEECRFLVSLEGRGAAEATAVGVALIGGWG
jgi:hypothetical protein